MPNLHIDIGNIELKNPVLLASGTCGVSAREFESYFKTSELGGIVTKSLGVKPWLGNPTPRIAEISDCGILNSIGLQNPGVEGFLKDELPNVKASNTTCIINIVGKSLDEYLGAIDFIKDKKDFAAIELNLSCPNVDGGLDFSQDPIKANEVVREVKKLTSIPIWAKLSPNITDITVIAKACIDAGIDGLSLINTVLGLAIDKKTKKPVLPRAVGGYSGRAIKPIALRMIYQTYKKFPNTPIIGIGGIQNIDDAIEFFLCGASAIQIGTASFKNPKTCIEIVEGLKKYMEENKIESIKEIVGKAH